MGLSLYYQLVPLLLILLRGSKAAATSTNRIILPLFRGEGDPNPVQAEIQPVAGGCFSWTHPEFLTVSLIPDSSCPENFAKAVLVSLNSPNDADLKQWQIIDAKRDNLVMQYSVFGKLIDRIDLNLISDKTTVLVGNVVTFKARVLMEDNLEFEFIDGLPFHWETSDSVNFRAKVKEDGLCDVLALDRGKTTVSLRLGDHAESDQVSSWQNLRILPLSFAISVLPCTDVQLELQREIGPFHPDLSTGWNSISFPSSTYSWTSTSPSKVNVSDCGLASALELGSSDVAIDWQHSIKVNVVDLVSIVRDVVDIDSDDVLSCEGEKGCQFIAGKRYSIRISLKTGQGDIHRGINVDFGVETSGVRVRACVDSSADKNAIGCIQTEEDGDGSVLLSVKPIRCSTSELIYTPQLTPVTINFTVRKPVKLVGPERLHLPWTGAAMSYTFSASGGSGNFSWSSSSGSALAIADPSSGVVSLTGTGESTVSVCDSSNDRNCKSVQVLVSKPVLQPMKLSRAEFEVSKESVQQVLVVGDEQKPFTDCLNLADKLSVSFPDDVFASVGSAACVPASDRSSSSHFLVGFKAVSAGVSSIITKLDELEHESKIAAFERLHVDPEQLIMSIGGSANLSWSGGPLQWDKDSELVVRLEPDTADVEMSLSAAGSNVLVVSCKRVLEATLELIVHNSVRPELSEPVESSASLSLKCYPPLRLSQRALRLTSGDQALVSVDESKAFGSSVKFSSDNEEIANVSSSGVVVARKRGVTTLRASAFDVFSDSIELVVSFSDFELVADRDWIYVGRSMLLELRSTAEGTFKGADLAGVDFQWSISSNDTAHLTTPFVTDLPPGVLMRLWGDAEADVEVRVIVRADGDEQELTSEFNMNIRERLDIRNSGSALAPSMRSIAFILFQGFAAFSFLSLL